MHREIQIKQFPIVTTHWWLRHETSGLCEKTNSIYIVFYLLYTTMSKWSECAHASGVWRVCARALAHAAFTRGVGVNAWRRACLKCGADTTFQAPTEASANQIASCKYPIPFMQHQRSMWLVVVTMTARQHHASDTPSVKRWRRRPVWMQREPERAHTHVTHRMRVSHTGCVFSHKPLVSCLRPSMCSYDGELFNLDFSVHVLFPSYRDSDLYLPLYDWQTRTVWPKNIKIGSTEEKKTPTSWMPLG